MRDELGSCAPGSFTAVVLFYIYGAAAGPAVARCESHDSSAGNRDGPVIQAPHQLHVTSLAPSSMITTHSSPRRNAHRHTWLHTRGFVPFMDTFIHLFSRTVSVQLPLQSNQSNVKTLSSFLYQSFCLRVRVALNHTARGMLELTGCFSLSQFHLQHPLGEVKSSTCPQRRWENSAAY